MTTERDDDLVDQWLRADAARGIDDNGFTPRVMGALPPPAPARRHALWKPALILGSTGLGVVLAIACAPVATAMMQGVADLYTFRGLTPAVLGWCAAIIAAAVGGAILAAED